MKPVVVAITVIIDSTVHGGLGRIGLNHVKNAGIAMQVRFAVNPPRYAKYVASRLMARVGVKVSMRKMDIARGVVRLAYLDMVVAISV